MWRILLPGLVVFVGAGVIGIDALEKMTWPHVQAKVVNVEPKCELKSEQYNVLTRVTSTATVDCKDVETFKILHPDKDWKVQQTYITHVTVAGAKPISTSLVLYSSPAPRAGDVLDLIQDPQDDLRVLKGNASQTGLIAALTVFIVGLFFVALRFAIRSRRRFAAGLIAPRIDGDDEGATPQPPPSVSPASTYVRRPAAAANASGRVFGRRA